MKTLIALIVGVLIVGCSNEKELQMLGKAHNNLQNEHGKTKKEIIRLKASLQDEQNTRAAMIMELKEASLQSAENLAAAIKNANAWKNGFDDSAKTNVMLEAQIKELKAEIKKLKDEQDKENNNE